MDKVLLDYITEQIEGLLAVRQAGFENNNIGGPLQARPVIVAIDGTAASGKTTLAAVLSERFDCNIFHMDDFFLRPPQRAPERLAEIGGNVDYERFRTEIIEPLLQNREFSYSPYSCHTQSFMPQIAVEPKQLNIIEGVYSRHPHFAEVIDIAIVLDIDERTQRERIIERNPDNYQKFFDLWIPLEKRYLESFV